MKKHTIFSCVHRNLGIADSCHFGGVGVYRSIEDVTRFSGLQQRRQLTYAAKQLIAREVCFFNCLKNPEFSMGSAVDWLLYRPCLVDSCIQRMLSHLSLFVVD